MIFDKTSLFKSVYGPVPSWRFGRSLGIDPIGPISTCTFNCVYCQLGEIQKHTALRKVYVPTEQIIKDLEAFDPWNVDVVTLSGGGEPTLALNLGDILAEVKELTGRPTAVLTNSTLMGNPDVRSALALADIVAAKLDAVSLEQLQRVNRPAPGITLPDIVAGLDEFKQDFQGHLAIQTMLLSPWSDDAQTEYIHLMEQLKPDEIQLNTPTRPRPLNRHLETRGNHSQSRSYPVQRLKQVSRDVLQTFANRIQAATDIPVRCVPPTAELTKVGRQLSVCAGDDRC